MEYANVNIRLAGSLENVVHKEVAASEIPILREVHGHDAVLFVAQTRTEKIDMAEERIRLDITYKPDVVAKIYAGASARLFENLADVGFASEAPAAKAKKV
jgi:hypothetical protein